jgi:lysozyme
MMNLIELLAGLLSTRAGKIAGLLAFGFSVVIFFMAISHRRDRMAKLPVISMLEKVQFMQRLDLISYHSNETLMLGDPDVLGKMIERAISDSLGTWKNLNHLTMEIEKAEVTKAGIQHSQFIYENELTDLQKQVDSAQNKCSALKTYFGQFIRKAEEMEPSSVENTFGPEIGKAWENYKAAHHTSGNKNDESRRNARLRIDEARRNLDQVWLQIKKESIEKFEVRKKLYDAKSRDLDHSPNVKRIRYLEKSLTQYGNQKEKLLTALVVSRNKIMLLKKAIVDARNAYENKSGIKNPRILAIIPAQVTLYINAQILQMQVLADSTIRITIDSVSYDPVNVVIDSSLHYNVARRKPEIRTEENGLYFEILEQIQLGVEVIKNRVLQKARSNHLQEDAFNKAVSYFRGIFTPFGYKVEVHLGPLSGPFKSSAKIVYKAPTLRPKKVNSKPAALLSSKTQGHLERKGIDVSHFNGTIDWPTVATQNVDFAYAKATQGTEFEDIKFSENWKNIKRAGIARGAYHFYAPADDPYQQAQFFISRVEEEGFDKNDLAPMLDLEGSNIGGIAIDRYQQNVLTWLRLVEEHFKVKPFIYTDNPFANKYLVDPSFTGYKLWIAEYTDAPHPNTPETWVDYGWHIWQRTADDKLKGIAGYVDHDLMVMQIK